MTAEKRVAIGGGGITGLATADFLQEQARALGQPIDITLIEAADRLGGKIQTERFDGFLIEGGPDAFLTQKPWAVQLCRELGLEEQLVAPKPGKTYVLLGGRLRRLPEGAMGLIPTRLGSFAKSELFSPWGKLRMGLDLVIPPRRDGHDESLAEFIKRRLGREALERLAEPLLAGVYAADPERLSIEATFPRLQELERQYRSLIRGVLRQQRQRQGGSSAHKDGKPPPVFLTLRAGLNTLVEALVARIEPHVAVLTGQRVAQLEPIKGGYRLALDGGRALEAEAVVLTTPAYVTAELIEALSPRAAELLVKIPYASTAVVTLAFRCEDVEHPLDGTGFVVPRVEGRALTACTWSSSKWPGRAPEELVLLRGFFGRAGQEGILQLNDDELIELAVGELRDLLGLRGQPIVVRVHRWPRAMPQYSVGHLEHLAQIESALTEHSGIVLAGAAYRGIGLPDCIRQGREASEKILRRLFPEAASASAAAAEPAQQR
jgi:oxygen-dependent protoporphyrinogen oxidase